MDTLKRGHQTAPPPLKDAPGSVWLLPAIIACFVIAGGAILFFFNPAHSSFYPFCLFYKTTGLLCPGCGGLRATHQLLHGHVPEALHLNALFVLGIPLSLFVVTRLWVAKRHGQPRPLLVKPG